MWRMLLGLLLVFARGEGPNSCSMIGHVSDEFRVSIAGATVSIRSAFSSDVQSTKTDENGMYKLSGLRQGRHSAFATADGYSSLWVFNVLLHPAEETRLDFMLPRSKRGQESSALQTNDGRTR
jgi:hypothetical protein